MPLIPNLRERLLTMPRHAAPGFMVDFLSAWGFRVIAIAFRLGVFDALRTGPKTPEELAAETDLHPRGVALMLDALTSLGYVRARGGRYENTRMTRDLMRTVPVGIRYFEKIVFKDWNHLEGQLRDGTGVRPIFLDKDWQVFNGGHMSLAKMNIAEVVKRVKVGRSARHVLDLGGGHGLYSIEFCRSHPQLRATVFDVPPMERLAKEIVADAGMEDRVQYRAGDFFTDDLESADVVLLFNVIHSKSEAENRELLKRVADSLRPGGVVALLDQFATPKLGNIGYAFGSLLALSMLSAAGQRTYKIGEVRGWFKDVGLTNVRFAPIRSAPGNGLVIARA